MDRSDVISLITTIYTKNSIGEEVAEEIERQVFCDVRNVTMSEWFDGGRNGLRPDYMFKVFAGDYYGEHVVRYHGVTYEIYRTYERRDDFIELYVQKKSGV